jgi:hypothetical protein
MRLQCPWRERFRVTERHIHIRVIETYTYESWRHRV